MATGQKRNLFNILKDSPWWMSAGLGAALFIALEAYFPVGLAFFAALPFFVISVYAGWQQLRRPGESRVAETLEKLRTLPWEQFSVAIEEAFRRDGYRVSRFEGGAADYLLEKNGRVALLSCKRWKATQTGIAPLRALEAARRAGDAQDCIFASAFALSPNAADFADAHAIRVLNGADLVQLVGRSLR